MEFNIDRVRKNVAAAETPDLLDRATVYRTALEPEALPIILDELRTRGVTAEGVVAYEAARWADVLDATIRAARPCSFCRRPAVATGWVWHRMFGILPVFPRPILWCADHLPASRQAPEESGNSP